ncbi:hypothetical protein [Corynebacterium renale]|nr:hypothetical protein [Corynebacterium renale]
MGKIAFRADGKCGVRHCADGYNTGYDAGGHDETATGFTVSFLHECSV